MWTITLNVWYPWFAFLKTFGVFSVLSIQINDFHVSLKKLEIGIVKNKSKAHYDDDDERA